VSHAEAAGPIELLVVEDNPGDVDLVGALLAEAGLGVNLRHAASGIEALDHLRGAATLPDVVLTDLNMPGMSGLDLVEALRREFPTIPVVLMTAYGSEEIAFHTLQKGASSYVPKNNLREGLPRTLQQIADLARAERLDSRLFECLVETGSTYRLENDPSLIPPLVHDLGASYLGLMEADETDCFRMSVALHEALTNAMFHGNLELSSSLRQDASTSDYQRLAEERRRIAPYRERRVHLSVRVTRERATYVVKDQGPGFNPSATADPRDRSNLDKVGGRGLFLIRTFMDEVRHNKAGNEITMIKKRRGR